MGRRFNQASKDANHDEIVADVVAAGLWVFETYSLAGFTDFIVSGYHVETGRLLTFFIEVKSEGGKLSERQKKLKDDAPDGLIRVAYNSHAVLCLYGML